VKTTLNGVPALRPDTRCRGNAILAELRFERILWHLGGLERKKRLVLNETRTPPLFARRQPLQKWNEKEKKKFFSFPFSWCVASRYSLAKSVPQ
jgi:hypothetical protein